MRLLTALFTTRPALSTDVSTSHANTTNSDEKSRLSVIKHPAERADDVVGILSGIVPNLPKIIVDQDRVLAAAVAISTNVIGPAIRARNFPETITKSTLTLLQELTRLPGNQKTWKKDISDAFNDARFFGSAVALVQSHWLPLLRQWTLTDNKDRMLEILARITPPTTAGIVFGVGATSARLESDRRTQLNLRRVAALVLAASPDAFAAELPAILDKLVELLGASATSSPSSTTRAEVYMVVRALVLRTSAVHLSPLWPVVNAELHAAVSSVAASASTSDSSAAATSADTYSGAAVLQACKLLDLLVVVAPDDFQLHEWLFVTDTVDAVYRSAAYQPVALVDELSEELGNGPVAPGALTSQQQHGEDSSSSSANTLYRKRRPLLLNISVEDTLLAGGGTDGGNGGSSSSNSAAPGGGNGKKDELVARVLRPFFAQLSIFAFESTYAMGALDEDACVAALLRDLFDERTIVRAL